MLVCMTWRDANLDDFPSPVADAVNLLHKVRAYNVRLPSVRVLQYDLVFEDIQDVGINGYAINLPRSNVCGQFRVTPLAQPLHEGEEQSRNYYTNPSS
jgi:hypothetical protein